MDPQAVIDGYVECAIWAEADTGEASPGGAETIHDLAPEALASIREDVEGFLNGQADDLVASRLEAGQIGHDLWLTRNGHGTGFWDRGLGVVGNRLADAARVYGGSDLYVGDDGKLYVS